MSTINIDKNSVQFQQLQHACRYAIEDGIHPDIARRILQESKISSSTNQRPTYLNSRSDTKVRIQVSEKRLEGLSEILDHFETIYGRDIHNLRVDIRRSIGRTAGLYNI